MHGWQRLRKNSLARLGAILLLLFYLCVFAADFLAPYDPYTAQVDGALLPPTQVHWSRAQGEWLGPHVYPTTQGTVNLETGVRQLQVNRSQASPIHWFVRGWDYQFLRVVLPLPTRFSFIRPLDLQIKPVTLLPGIASNLHLFGTEGAGKLNLLGTDDQARDQFSRLLFGGRISLSIGLVGVIIAYPLGMLVGGISGYFGGWIDTLLMRFAEVLMTIPSIYLLIALAAVLPPGLTSSERFFLIVLITSFISWAGLARVIRGQVLSLKQLDYVQAAKAMGAGSLHIIWQHILPQTASYLLTSATLTIPSFIVAESVLSLIGLGIQAPDPSWGNMLSLSTNASVLALQPWLIWPPAILIVMTVLAFNLVGDGLRDALDPRNLQKP
jgi:peptide/nickel transport system permease protein